MTSIDPNVDSASAIKANDAFYLAFQAMEMAEMAAVWSHAPEVCCIHPGWEPLIGWGDVRQSFVAIFAGQGWLRVAPSEVEALVEGDMAWVRCVEVVSSLSSFGPSQARVAATNLFRREAGEWKLVLHHGSPIASQRSPDAETHAVDDDEDDLDLDLDYDPDLDFSGGGDEDVN